MSGALGGLRVIDCSRLIAGGVLATILADHGADVIKVENPRGGDPLRTWLRDRGELWWKVYARGKRSVTLNLAHARGSALLRRLCRGADVLIENYRPGTFEKWGLGWDVSCPQTIPVSSLLASRVGARTAPIEIGPGSERWSRR